MSIEAGWICPKCKGEDGQLSIDDARTAVNIYDDGVEAIGDIEWDDKNRASCTCGWIGTAGEAAQAAEEAQTAESDENAE
jgi:hypothetical protein